jgi:CxxC-x17-CxxC domain-containing protein
MSDQELYCRDCDEKFIFTSGEQAFYESKGLKPPNRCPSCRQARKGDRIPQKTLLLKPMYRIRCDACDCESTVPFEPTPGRIVLCRECHRRHKAGLLDIKRPCDNNQCKNGVLPCSQCTMQYGDRHRGKVLCRRCEGTGFVTYLPYGGTGVRPFGTPAGPTTSAAGLPLGNARRRGGIGGPRSGPCNRCKATGWVECRKCDGQGYIPCRRCQGRGEVSL